jgi:hypothetical protein
MDLLPELTSSVLFFVKYALIAFIVVYTVFALIVVRQVKVMNQTLDVGFEKSIFLISVMHLVFALIVLFLAIFLL